MKTYAAAQDSEEKKMSPMKNRRLVTVDKEQV
jgi:hypothetical protein